MRPTIKVAIIEDESSAVNRLTKELNRMKDLDFEIVSIISSVEKAIDWLIQQHEVDLLFMDIQLSDGLSFEIFKRVEVSCPVIFTTAFDEYALEAFKVNSLDYVLKPINPEDLEHAMDRYLKLSTNFAQETYFNQLMQMASRYQQTNYRSSFLVSYRHKMIMIDISEVAYIYIKERGVFLKKKDGAEHVLEFFLDDLEKQLNPSQFYRANRQYLVSRSSIIEIEPYFTGRLLLKVHPESSSPVIISKEKGSDFKRWADY